MSKQFFVRSKKIFTHVFFFFMWLIVCQHALAEENVLLLTDIHFNPYEGCSSAHCQQLQALIDHKIEEWPNILQQASLNTYHQETNNALLVQGLNKISAADDINYQPQAIFILGDLLAHKFTNNYSRYTSGWGSDPLALEAFTRKSVDYVVGQIHQRFPLAKIYLVLGNNDSDVDDYQLGSQTLLAEIADDVSSFTSDPIVFKTTFATAGYFRAPLTSNVDVIGLNTNMLSPNASDQLKAWGQLDWLNAQLADAQRTGKQVILLQHIPYGADMYASATAFFGIKMVMDDTLQQAYLHTLDKYASNIREIFVGHYHAEYFGLINQKTPVIGNIALNAGFGNNPGFKELILDDEGALKDYTTYVTSLTNSPSASLQWKKLYRFSEVYGNAQSFSQALAHFPSNTTQAVAQNYQKNLDGDNPQDNAPVKQAKLWKYYYCAINHIARAEYEACVKQF